MKRIALLALVMTAIACGGGGGGGGGGNEPSDPGYISRLDGPTEQRIDTVIRDFQFDERVAGASLGIVRDGQVVLVKGYGSADIGPGTPVDANTPFEIGTVTQTFTAFGVLRIADDPRLIAKVGVEALDLDERIGTYLADSPNVPIPPRWENVTVRELLTMTSGIPHGDSDTKIWQVIVAEAAGRPLEFDPGAGFCPSSPGYLILGELIQELSGLPYAEFMQRNVFTPLGLTRTAVLTGGNIPAGIAKGYEWVDTAWTDVPRRSPISAFSSGAIVSTAGDLAKFLLAIQQGRILSEAAYDEMLTAFQLPGRSSQWGFGWNVIANDEIQIYRKDGRTPGYSTQVAIYAHHGVAVALCTNENGVGTSRISADVVRALLDSEFEPNPPPPPVDCPQ